MVLMLPCKKLAILLLKVVSKLEIVKNLLKMPMRNLKLYLMRERIIMYFIS